MAEPRTLVRQLPVDHQFFNGDGMFELCIDESNGCGLSHSHDWGHDFPMERDELVKLRDQIDAALKQ